MDPRHRQFARALATAIMRMPERDLRGHHDDRHVMPEYGREHDSSPDCWCGPSAEDVPGARGRVWLHREQN